MALELVGGAGAFVGELLKAVIDARQRASTFQPALARLESTLKAMIPRLDQTSCLNSQLNLQQPEMEKLVDLITNGKTLVLKCSKISTINFVKKAKHSKELLDLDNSLVRYFMTVLPLDHFKDTEDILVVVKELVGDCKDGVVCDHSESAGTPKEDSTSGAPETVKLLQDSNHEVKQKALLAQANDAKFQGIKLFGQGLYVEALSEYELALLVAPEIPSSKDLRSTCYANRAICFLKLGKYEDTIRECSRALELNPDYLQALIKRGEAHKMLGQFDEAIADMETLISKLVPKDVQSQRTKDVLVAAVKRLEMKLVDDKAEGGICDKDADDATTSTADVRQPNVHGNGGVQVSSDSLLDANSGRESVSSQDGSMDGINSTNPASSTLNSNQVEGAEWIEQYEPGVYVTLVALWDGTRDIKQVRFSRRSFEELQAEIWWSGNREKVYERYNVRSIGVMTKFASKNEKKTIILLAV